MIVKVCGLREADNIRAVTNAAPDCYGFIFYPRSPRFVDKRPTYLPETGRRIGVFVHPTVEDVECRIASFGLHGIQLHGDVTPDFCKQFRKNGLTVIRALPASDNLDALTHSYIDAVDYFLFDTPTEAHGGSGRYFDWRLLETYTGDVPFLLSGGLSPASLPTLATLRHPRWAGIDLNSGFEMAPAVKDADKLHTFIRTFRHYYST